MVEFKDLCWPNCQSDSRQFQKEDGANKCHCMINYNSWVTWTEHHTLCAGRVVPASTCLQPGLWVPVAGAGQGREAAPGQPVPAQQLSRLLGLGIVTSSHQDRCRCVRRRLHNTRIRIQQILTKLREYSGCNNAKQDQRIFMSSSHFVTILFEKMQLMGKKYFVSVKSKLVQYNACKRKEIRVK